MTAPIIGYDTDQPFVIPATAKVVFPYVDGPNPWPVEYLGKWPYELWITREGDYAAQIADCEPGLMTISQTVNWAQQKNRMGLRPTCYSDQADFATLQRALGAGSDYWVADPTGIVHLVAGSQLTQYAWPGRGSPGHYDLTVIDPSYFAYHFPGATTPSTPVPLMTGDSDVKVLQSTRPGDSSAGLFLLRGEKVSWESDPNPAIINDLLRIAGQTTAEICEWESILILNDGVEPANMPKVS